MKLVRSKMQLPRRFEGIWISKRLWECQALSLQEKAFLAEIHSLDADDSGCMASNLRFAKFFGISRRRVITVLQTLLTAGLIECRKDPAYPKVMRRKVLWDKVDELVNKTSPMMSEQKFTNNGEGKFTDRVNKSSPVISEQKFTNPFYIEENTFKNTDITQKNTKEKVSFSFETGRFENITPEEIQAWSQAYPAVNIELTIRQAAQWLLSNPTKTKSNYRRFLTNWFARCQERGGTKGGIVNVRKYRENTTYEQRDPAALIL